MDLPKYSSTHDRPLLCRTYLVMFLNPQPIPSGVYAGTFGTLWAMGCRNDGQTEALGTWCSGDPLLLGREMLEDLRLRGVERVHLVVHPVATEGDVLEACARLGTHVLPSPADLIEQSLAQVGPRARQAMSRAIRPMVCAESVEGATEALSRFAESSFGARHPAMVAAWRDAVVRLAPLYRLPKSLGNLLLLGDGAAQSLRRSLGRSIRRRGSFPSREAAATFLSRALGSADLGLSGAGRAPAPVIRSARADKVGSRTEQQSRLAEQQ
jgi:transposase-like protein